MLGFIVEGTRNAGHVGFAGFNGLSLSKLVSRHTENARRHMNCQHAGPEEQT